jgi:hypothetical protein
VNTTYNQGQTGSNQPTHDDGLAEQVAHPFPITGAARPDNQRRRSYGDKIGDKGFKERKRRYEVDRSEDLIGKQIAGNDLINKCCDDFQQYAQGRPQEYRKNRMSLFSLK